MISLVWILLEIIRKSSRLLVKAIPIILFNQKSTNNITSNNNIIIINYIHQHPIILFKTVTIIIIIITFHYHKKIYQHFTIPNKKWKIFIRHPVKDMYYLIH